MILILGVTASGKSKLAFELAQTTGAEIVSIDSMKVYKRMDIGTAKPPLERQKQVKYHLIDVVEPFESFSVDRFLALTDAAIEQIQAGGKPVIAAGGTAMYIKTLLYGLFEGPPAEDKLRQELKDRIQTEGTANLHAELTRIDPTAAERIHPNDERRIIRAIEVYQLTGKPISSFQKQFESEQMRRDWTIIGLRRPKPVESSRINLRVKKMIEAGLVDEVRSLLAEDKPIGKQAACAIGYAEIIDHLNGNLSLDEAIEKIKINTRRLAKGQRTWFKTFKNVNWIDAAEDDTDDDILQKTLALIDP